MSSRYVDLTAITQVLGCIFNKNSILDYDDKYPIIEEDFTEDFHKVVFGAIYNLHLLGSKSISLKSIYDYLSTRPKSLAIYNANKGEEYLTKASIRAEENSFDLYYDKMKKMGLLRAYDLAGVDVSFLYDPDNIFDIKKSQEQQDWLDSHSVLEIANIIDEKIESIKRRHVDNIYNDSIQAGDGIEELIEKLLKFPEAGLPMFGSLINTITRGSRLKKFYLRSAPSGVGKTRAMVADAAFMACDRFYDNQFGWIKNGTKEPSVLISTELEKEEVQTLILAFLSNVDEEKILNGKYENDEQDRVREAGRIMKESPLYIEILPDFSMRDIEYTIKRNIREHNVSYIYLDYIHTSLKILEEITKRTGGVKLREDNILFMLSIRLKDLCNEYGVFLMSATQLNGDWKDAKIPDQNLLRGAKAIADKIDFGAIMLPVTQADLDALAEVNDFFQVVPNLKISIYKNRRGRFKSIYLWCDANLGTCRINPIFVTTYEYDMIEINDSEYVLQEDEKYVFS